MCIGSSLCDCGCLNLDQEEKARTADSSVPPLAMAAGDDYASSTATTGTVAPGGTATGTIEVAGDRDWFAVTLQAGQSYDITLQGGTLIDSYLRVWDANGTSLLAENDDVNFGGGDYSSALSFTASSGGTYYLSAGGYEGQDATSASTGTYTLSVSAGTTPPPSSPVDSLDLGAQLNDNTVTYFFLGAGQSFGGVTSEGWNAYEQSRVLASFDTIEAVIDVTFVAAADANSADFVLVLDTDGDADGALGWFQPSTGTGGIGVFNANLWDRTAGGSLEDGGYDYVTITHELLHGFWLDHPHDGVRMDGVTSAFGDYGDFNLNQGIYTTMSYNTGFPNTVPGDPGNDWGYEIGPMALDIAALQEKYGANTTHATGNDVYDLPDANVSGTGWISIWDAGGTDEIRYTGSRDATIDLRAATLLYEEGGGGFVSAANSIAGGYTIANGVVIENARSGDGNDDITGNDAANRINSGRGADTIEGGAGNDVIIGAQGSDEIDGGADDDKVNGHNGADSVNGGAGKDKVIGFNGEDTLAGGTENDLLIGGAHADLFIFNLGDGRDRIKDFEDDIDTLQLDADLFNEAAPVAADIVNYAGTNAAGDVVLSFGAERIVFTGITDVNVLIDDVVIA